MRLHSYGKKMVRSGLTARTRQKQVILPQLGDQGLDCDQMAAGIKTKPLGGPVKPGGNGGAREQLDLSRMQRGGGGVYRLCWSLKPVRNSQVQPRGPVGESKVWV